MIDIEPPCPLLTMLPLCLYQANNPNQHTSNPYPHNLRQSNSQYDSRRLHPVAVADVVPTDSE